MNVTGIDMTESMLAKIKEKHPDKDMRLICGNFFVVDFGNNIFDCAVSFESMHHFYPERKLEIYKKIYASLKNGGTYIECDYMVGTQLEQDHYFKLYEDLKKEQNISKNVYCHFDTPCSVEVQIKLLNEAGFESVKKVFQMGNTVMLYAQKV